MKVKVLCRHYDRVAPRHEITEDLIRHVTPCRHLKEEYVRQRVAYLTGYSVIQNNATVTLIGAEMFSELFRGSISITETDRVVEDYITSFFDSSRKPACIQTSTQSLWFWRNGQNRHTNKKGN